ncbi:MAG: PAS domain S-box protein [Nitrospinae bacterium]|nr:PAS domain S-box protein [Nitrospinota bacterium]
MAAFQSSSPFIPHTFLLPVAAITGLMGFAVGHSGKSPWAGGLCVLVVLLAIAFFMARALMKRVKESETRARLVFENVVDGIMAIDDSGVIWSFNPAAEDIFGYRAYA